MRTLLVILLLVGGFAGGAALLDRGARISEKAARARDLTGGDPDRGRVAARALGCLACHTAPSVRGPRPIVGPPFEHFAKRPYIAGVVENTPGHLIQFIREPRSLAPKSAMPKLEMSENDARDLAAFLYTLR